MNKYNQKQNKAVIYNNCVSIIEYSPDFVENWKTINDAYNLLYWEDKLTDQERIKEYQRINELFNKYIKTNKQELLHLLNENPIRLLNVLDEKINTKLQIPKNGWTRDYITYIKLRRTWLKRLMNEVIKLNKFKDKEE